jgi:single-strand DNA-binding protein
MSNIVILVGRLTGDPETKTAGSTTITRATIAVERSFKQDGQPTADFIRIFMFGKTGDTFAKYHHKGSPASVVGEWRAGSYTDSNGQKHNTNECLVSRWEFLPKDKSQGGNAPANADSFVNNTGGGIDEEQPFT